MLITSLNNKMVLYANSLKEKKYRDIEKKYLIEGEHLISMATDIECIFTTDLNYVNDKATVYYVSENVLKKLSFVQAPQGIIAIVNKQNYSFNDGLSSYLLCDKVADPGNMGTIIRTALAFNVDMIILENGSVDIYNEKVIRSSQGAILKCKIIYASLSDTILKLQNNNVKVYASTLSDRSINLKDVKKIGKYALVVGNEGSGVSKHIQDISDYNIKIMHSNAIDSLNVGVATSIMLYYFDSLKK
ncbi:MAG: RNA methyltransferase [Erysipelotrichaceae bacterium]|nr:RNA methyltransferase [Erysipelotrichaceae bacterium]